MSSAVAAPVGRAGELRRPYLGALQVGEQREHAFGEAAGVGDAVEVRQLLPPVQVGDQVVGEEPALHVGQRAGRRVVGADDLLGEVLKGEEARGQEGGPVQERFADRLDRAPRRAKPQGGAGDGGGGAVALQEAGRLARAGGTAEDVDRGAHVQ